jgi:type II secretory pathway component PulM
MKQLSKRDKRALTILGAVGVVILLAFAIVLPFYSAKSGVASELEDKEQLLRRYVQVLQEEVDYRFELSQLDRMLNGYRQRLLDAQDISMATIQLEEVVRTLAAQNGIQVTRSNPLQEREVGENYVKITLQLNLRSDMSQLTGFLYALSANPKFLLVENFFLNSLRSRDEVRIQPRMNVSGFIRLS